MNITPYINSFAKKPHRYRPYSKICKKLILGSMPYSLNSQNGYEESNAVPGTLSNG